ncbi:MAG: hypothetical protein NTW13_06005 [Candidatus Omnitrophica bacterium]|nr:hypothetical protein [Candidatus Omnitrophota bacterium]
MLRKTILLLILVVILVYSNSFNNGFVLDDEVLVTNNHLIRSLDSLPQIFNSKLYQALEMYRPLQVLSYCFDYKIWGLSPFGFHLGNVFLHILNSILVYLLFCLISTAAIALPIALLFAVHPINTSVVSYISARADLLVTFFMLLSIICFGKFIRLKSLKWYFLSLLSAFVALFCRENSLTLFLFIILIGYNLDPKRKIIRYVIPFLLLDLFYIVFRLGFLGNSNLGFSVSVISLPFQVINFLNISFRYLYLLIFPFGLYMFRSTPFIVNFFNFLVIIIVIFTFLCCYFLYRLRKKRMFLFGVLWFLFGLFPVYLCFGRYFWLKQAIMAESWLYLPSIGVFVLFTLIKNKFAKLGNILLILVVVFYGFLTWRNNTLWKDNITAYKNILEHLPGRTPVRKNLIKEYLLLGFYNDAWLEIKKFGGDYPESSDRYALQGDYYYAINNISQAIENYKISLRLNRYNLEVSEKLKKLERKNAK